MGNYPLDLKIIWSSASLSPIWSGFTPGFVNYKKGALDSQTEVIKFTSCLPMIGGSLPGTQASSTTKTGRHDIAESGIKPQKSIIT